MDNEKAKKLLSIINGLFSSIRGDWTDPRWECREGWEGVSHLRELLGIRDGDGYRHVNDRTVDEYISSHEPVDQEG